MKFIKLHYRDREMFDAKLDISDYVFFHNHRDAFRQMIKEQGKDFWIRFMLTFRTASTKFGAVGRILSNKCSQNCRGSHVVREDMLDWFFIQLHNIIIEGTVGECKQLMDDVALISQNQHVFRNVFCKSLTKDPFYMPATRDAFRRLFGSQLEKLSYMRIVMFPVYETFCGSWCQCLRQWVDASEMADPTDQSYWIQPTNDTPDEDLDINMDQQCRIDFLKLAMALAAERNMGSASGPVFVQGWPKGTDPRFNEPSNPLYNPKAKRGSDWRNNVDFDQFLNFIVYCQKTENALLADKSVACELNGKHEQCAMCGCDPPGISELNEVFSEKLKIVKSDTLEIEIGQVNVEGPGAADKSHRTTKTTTKKANRLAKTHESPCEKNVFHQFNGSSIKLANSKQGKMIGPVETSKQETVAPLDQGMLNIAVASCTMQTFSEVIADEIRPVSNNPQLSLLGQNSHHNVDEEVRNGSVHDVPVHMECLLAGSQTSSSHPPTENHDATSSRLRVCSNCLQTETRPHEFKKCKKCKEMKLQNAKYYCGRECQVADWDKRHRLEHRTIKVDRIETAFTIGPG